jgi:mannose-6-phosphate isomerase-like protein (cupin superfamily)
MMEIQSYKQIKPFVTKDESEIKEILSPGNSSLRKQSLAEAKVLPGRETKEHRHQSSEEIYYILRGEGRIKIEDEVREIGQGDAIPILPERRHKVWNTGAGDLIILCYCSPAYSDEDTILVE